jgi:hypothetical protein
MRTVLKFIPAVGTFLLGGGLQISGIVIPWLGYSLMGFGLVLLFIPFWSLIKPATGSDLVIKVVPNKSLSNYLNNEEKTRNPFYSIIAGHQFKAMFNLIITNHNMNYPIRIKSAFILLRKRLMFWNGETIFSNPLQYDLGQKEFTNIVIEPNTEKEYSIITGGDISTVKQFPKKSRLILHLELIGTPRSFECILKEYKHRQKEAILK